MRTALRWLLGLVLVAVLGLAALLWVADTGIGHRYIADRIDGLKLESGLRIKVGRIEGSIYGRTRLIGLKIADARGVFFESDAVAVDWTPSAWLNNRLDIDRLTAPSATLYRMPALKPSATPQPILPSFDIRIGHFQLDRLTIGPAIVRPTRVARFAGRADIHNGRALVDLDARASSGDRVTVMLDSEPDRNKFDVAAAVDAPANGVLAGMTGLPRPLMLRLGGRGSWTDWRGVLLAQSGKNALARLTLAARSGRYDLQGMTHPSLLLGGTAAALIAPGVAVKGNARLDNRRLDTHLALASPALAASANGIVDLTRSSFEGMRVDVHLLRSQAVLPTLSGRDIAARVVLDGPFSTAAFDYLVTAPRAAIDATGFEDVRISGRGRLSPQPFLVPLRLTASRVTGVGTVAGGILGNLSVEGVLRITSTLIASDNLRVRSDKLNGVLTLIFDIPTGVYSVGLSGQLSRYLIPGLGIVDVRSVLKVVPGPNGQGIRIAGRGQVWVRRLDNASIAGLTGGLPYIDTALERSPDGTTRFTGLKLRSPALTLDGSGFLRPDGTVYFQGTGQQRTYGPLKITVDGPMTRPKVDLILAHPLPSAGLTDVHAQLLPTSAGYEWTASGGSMLGPFSGHGAILLPTGGQTVVRIAALTVAGGITAAGDLRVVNGGIDGALSLSGGAGLKGTVQLAVVRAIQRVEAHLTARDLKLAGPPVLVVARGQLDVIALLDPKGTSVDATFAGQGLRRGDITLARLAANARLRGGVGEVRANFAGSRGRGFDIQTVVKVAPDRYVLSGQGTVDRRPIALLAPAVVVHENGGYRLQPATLAFAGGKATVAGRFGGDATDLDATIERMPLTVLDIASPDLGLGGSASGHVAFHQPSNGGSPTGSAELRVRNLTRAGLVLTSKPVDAGINARLDSNGFAMRAIAASGGQTIGQAQARIAPLGAGGSYYARLANAPLLAQLRYNGPADTLWRLTGVESFDLSGPIAVAADVGGRLTSPILRGSVHTDNLRLESPLSGTVLTGIKANGRFDRSKLILDGFSANAGRGTLTGHATFDLASAHGFGIDVTIDAKMAALIGRDDFSATVTGPLHIVSDGPDGRISGNIVLDRSAFRLGQATAAAQVPTLNVRELNRPFGSPRVQAAPTLFALDIKARAEDRLAVTGLGLDSEWRADLQLKGTLDAPEILGRAEVVRGGYEFAGKRFDLQRGVIRFQGAYPPNPVLDIVANANIQAINATITVTGTGQHPDIVFASVPALPQDELLSRLLFGTSITNLSAPEALQLASAVGSLRGGNGLDPINAVRKAIGLDRLRFVPADATIGNKTAVAVGKYVTRRTYVELVTDGQGYSATRVEFAITRFLSLLSTVSTVGRQSAAVRISKDY